MANASYGPLGSRTNPLRDESEEVNYTLPESAVEAGAAPFGSLANPIKGPSDDGAEIVRDYVDPASSRDATAEVSPVEEAVEPEGPTPPVDKIVTSEGTVEDVAPPAPKKSHKK